jgi:hypothetical protein
MPALFECQRPHQSVCQLLSKALKYCARFLHIPFVTALIQNLDADL